MAMKTLEDKIKALKKVPLFEDLSKKQLGEIAKLAEITPAAAGTMLVQHGKPGKEFILILFGDVSVMRYGKILRELTKGDFFGEISLLDGGLRTASLVAKSDVNLLVVPKKGFDQLLKEVPGLQTKMIHVLCKYLRDSQLGQF